jgi:conjugative transfer signal peptidase TraF
MLYVAFLATLLGVTLLGWGAHVLGFRMNTTTSMPIGLYLLTDGRPGRGDYVTFCLPPGAYPREIAASCLGQSHLCPTALKPLLKHLVGLPGDVVQVTPAGLLVNGHLQPNSGILTTDQAGKSIPSFLSSGVIPQGKALVLSGYDPHSFDSRYFGLVRLASLHKVLPVITFCL